MFRRCFAVCVAAFLLTSCVSKKKYNLQLSELEALKLECAEQVTTLSEQNKELEGNLQDAQSELSVTKGALQAETDKASALANENEYLKGTNTNLLERLSDLSVINKAGAESIKKSLEAISDQNKYIQGLNASIQQKDSLNLALVMNLKRSLADVNDEDVTVEVKKGVVYISLSDKMLFRSGSSTISSKADDVLSKIAQVVNDHSDFDILVEGHTDNVPISSGCVQDNWDLSVDRATAVVRALQNKYNVDPARMTAGGRAEYIPKADNETSEGRSTNRRTEIIVLPKLEQFFELLAPAGTN
ncbi:MAG: OmpA family protein [Bacteroidota bacterium]